MLSVHLDQGSVTVRDIARPERPPGFALIRTRLAGICNTDLELQRGYYNFSGTPGHEFVGEVVEADERNLIGRRVVGEINLTCGGDCPACLRGMPSHCERRTVLGIVNHPGAFQEFFTLPQRNLHVVPEEITDAAAVFTEPLAAACRIFDQVDHRIDGPVAVLGDGKLGLLIAMAMQARGFRPHLYGRHRKKLEIAGSAGVSTSVGPPPAGEFELVVDATGSPDGIAQAIAAARPRGTVVMKSTISGKTPIDLAAAIVNEIQLVGSRCGRFEPALELLREGAATVNGLIEGTMPLAQAPEAFARAAQSGTLKVLLSP